MKYRLFSLLVFLIGIPVVQSACGHFSESNIDTNGNDSDSDSDSDSDTDSDTDTDQDTDTDTEYPTWRLHDEFESLVYVFWNQKSAGKVWVEYQVDGKWLSTPAIKAEKGLQTQLIAGIPYGTDARWRVAHEEGKKEDGPLITTGHVPSGLPIGAITVSDENKWLKNGNYLLTSMNQDQSVWAGGIYWAVIIDRKGRYVWARKASNYLWTLYAQTAVTGDHLLIDETSYWPKWDNGETSVVRRMYLDKEIEVISTQGLHHAFVQLPDETLAWGSKYHGKGESLVEKAKGASKATVIWNSEKDWPESSEYGYCESNCLFYNESTNTYLYSFYTNDAVVEVDRASGESLWWAGGVPNGYSFDPKDSQYEWQHGVSYTSDMTLLVSTKVSGKHATEAREYEVDHKNQTLKLIWSYDPGAYADYNGDTWRLANGNTLHVVGSAGHIVEVDQDGNTVWRFELSKPRLLGRGQFIEDLYKLISPR